MFKKYIEIKKNCSNDIKRYHISVELIRWGKEKKKKGN